MAKLSKYEIVFCITSFLLGLDIGVFVCPLAINQFKFNINPQVSFQIDPLQIISLLITIILAVYVSRQLTKKDDEERVERKLLIDYLNNFELESVKSLSKISKDGTGLTEAIQTLKECRKKAFELVCLAEEQGLIKKESINTKKLDESIKSLQDLITKTPREGEVEDGVRLDGGKLYFSSIQKDKIANNLFLIKAIIFKVITEVNRGR